MNEPVRSLVDTGGTSGAVSQSPRQKHAPKLLIWADQFVWLALLLGVVVAAAQTSCIVTSAKSPAASTSNVRALITTQPVSQSVTIGQRATFFVVASGAAPLTYHWSRSGVAISGAMSASYTTPATAAADNGVQFTVTVSNSRGKVTSSVAILIVITPGPLTPSRPSLSFGNVNVGSSSTLVVMLTNSGGSSVTTSDVSISGAGFNASGIPRGTILAGGQTVTLNATFTPAASGSATGSVTVTSNAVNSPTIISLTGSAMQSRQSSVTIAWITNWPNIAGYNVYKATVSGGPYTKLNSSLNTPTSYTDATVQDGQTYYYVVTEVNSNNIESVYSSAVSAVIPAP